MDDQDRALSMQPAQSTIDEDLHWMEPLYRGYKNTMRGCIAGLTDHAARLAAQGREEQAPRLRQICIEMAEFWDLNEDDSPQGFQKLAEQYGGDFDRAVSSARVSGCALEMSGHTKRNVLEGLELYAREMTESGDMERWVAECHTLAAQLRAEWGMGSDAPRQAQMEIERNVDGADARRMEQQPGQGGMEMM